MRVLLAVLVVGIAGCGDGSSPPGGGTVPTTEGSQAKADESPAQTAAKQKAAAKKSVEFREPITLTGHGALVKSVSFSPDGKRIVSGSGDKTVKIWDAETGEEILALIGHSHGVNSVSFSADGKRIVSGSGDTYPESGVIKVWDAETGQEMLTVDVHTQRITSVSFSPDGKRIVSGSSDKTVKVWDILSLDTPK